MIADVFVLACREFFALRVVQREHAVEPRVDPPCATLDEDALAFLGGEDEPVDVFRRTYAAIDDTVERDAVRLDALVIRLGLADFRAVADAERARVADAELPDRAHVVIADGHVRRDADFESRRRFRRIGNQFGGDAGVAEIELLRLVEIPAASFQLDRRALPRTAWEDAL